MFPTEPLAVTNLTVVDSNSSTIRLSWSQQSDHKSSYSYLVTINGISVNRSLNTTVEYATLTDLVPGSPYTIAVVVVVETVMSDPTITNSSTSMVPKLFHLSLILIILVIIGGV